MDIARDTYIRLLQKFLNNPSLVEDDDIEIYYRIGPGDKIIGMKFKRKSRIKMRDGDELILNLEIGHVNGNKYSVGDYNYHYNNPNNYFRFESKGPGPHINDNQGIHWFYEEDIETHSKKLQKDVTGLNTKEMNIFIMLIICRLYIFTNKYPVHSDNWDFYNKIILRARRLLNG